MANHVKTSGDHPPCRTLANCLGGIIDGSPKPPAESTELVDPYTREYCNMVVTKCLGMCSAGTCALQDGRGDQLFTQPTD